MKTAAKYFCLLIAFFSLFFVFNVSKANAATLYFSPSSGNFTVGNIFTINVLVNTEGVVINNAEAIVNFPSDLLEIVSVSKSGSIFSLWVEEPTFSNSTGILSLNGGLPTPGFNGTAGKVLSAVFKVKKQGSASLVFSSAAVRANDGYGTNVLTSLGNTQFNLGGAVPTVPTIPEEITPSAVSGAPSAPQIFSPTHSDPNKWYSNKNPQFSWVLPTGVNGVSIYFSQSPTSNPGPVPSGLFTSKSYENIEDGIWYFHIKFRNSAGWGPITHFKVQIDTEPPQSFEIIVKDGKETTNPRPILYFETKDDLSGIEYYEVKIEKEDEILQKAGAQEHNPFQMPLQNLGKHIVIVKAVDGAGNYTLAATEVNILPIEKPIITEYPWAFLKIGPLAIDYLTTLIGLLILIFVFVIVLGIIWIRRKRREQRKRFKKEISKAEKALYKAFKSLKEKTEEQVAELDGKPGLNDREKKICNDLKEALEISEKFIGEEIKDIEKEVK